MSYPDPFPSSLPSLPTLRCPLRRKSARRSILSRTCFKAKLPSSSYLLRTFTSSIVSPDLSCCHRLRPPYQSLASAVRLDLRNNPPPILALISLRFGCQPRFSSLPSLPSVVARVSYQYPTISEDLVYTVVPHHVMSWSLHFIR